ncbi:Fe-S protein assembly co-chaperone HscB [Poriferisphaera sp. WC338]|uniref:Fe-S protein assembly co-chaperone HscB n=1 Tax=Poriferisphaera sp. WC338 TaxID=3425129 RepID=UPI003D814E1E
MNQDPYSVLGIAKQFNINQNELQRKFIALSAENHPDKFIDPIEQIEAAERSAAINTAYHALKDPEERANILLTVLGGPSKEADNSLPPTLLMEMMEIREEMEEAIAAKNESTLNKLRQWANEERDEYLSLIGPLFAKASNNRLDDATAKQIRLHLNGLRYIERMIEQMPPPTN